MTDNVPSAALLLERCSTLLNDIKSLENLVGEGRGGAVDVKHFKGAIQSEQRTLQRLATADPVAEKTIHNLRSSNLPFYEALWATAKLQEGVLGLQKKVYWEKTVGKSSEKSVKKKRKSALVDIIAEQGLQWIKISLISENKLLFEKAKAGWEAEEWDSSEDDGRVKKIYPDGVEPPPEPSDDESEDEYGRIELVKVAQELKKASEATRVRFKHPRVSIVLPNIKRGQSEVVDGILDELKATGAAVKCGYLPAPVVNDTFVRMLPALRPQMTSTLNLDCTILLALISDLSHHTLEELVLPDKPHPSLQYQVEVERSMPLLPNVLYPGLEGSHRLVTSRKSADRMWEIVQSIGTNTERSRAALFVADETTQPDATPRSDRIRDLNSLSCHALPDLPLPVEILESEALVKNESIPNSLLSAVSKDLSEINRSVFLLGWTRGLTTVTSNKVAVKLIENVLTKELNKLQRKAEGEEDEVEGPMIWAIDIARSLVGKEGGRAV